MINNINDAAFIDVWRRMWLMAADQQIFFFVIKLAT
jgi:hypothetical protein